MVRAVHIGRGSCRQCANEKKCAAVLHVWWDVCAVCCVYGKRDKIQAVVGGLHNFSLRSAPNRRATATDNGNNNRKRNIFSRSRWCAWKVVFMRAQAIVIVYAQQFSLLCTGQVFMCAHLLAVRWKSFFFLRRRRTCTQTKHEPKNTLFHKRLLFDWTFDCGLTNDGFYLTFILGAAAYSRHIHVVYERLYTWWWNLENKKNLGRRLTGVGDEELY